MTHTSAQLADKNTFRTRCFPRGLFHSHKFDSHTEKTNEIMKSEICEPQLICATSPFIAFFNPKFEFNAKILGTKTQGPKNHRVQNVEVETTSLIVSQCIAATAITYAPQAAVLPSYVVNLSVGSSRKRHDFTNSKCKTITHQPIVSDTIVSLQFQT